ncbi:hypothetical protein [Polaromonas sp. YR568]|uniref:hypothetical protein n=1 Tax=Polaromonas sp. YR568 TaxID=1855301 RepID=UPI00398BE52D
MAAYRFEIELFLSHFREQAASIAKVVMPFHRKVLYAAAFDPLARAAYGTVGSHRDRFVRLIRELAKWSDADNVSLPQLQLRLREAKRYRYRLYRETSRRLDTWNRGMPNPLSQSPKLPELISFATTSEHIHLKEAQYVHLLYTYRNNLLHEFREPGYGTDWSGTSKEPFYGSSIYGPWELVLPGIFFATLYEHALQGLEAHLLQEKINPYDQFQFGSLWRRK